MRQIAINLDYPDLIDLPVRTSLSEQGAAALRRRTSF